MNDESKVEANGTAVVAGSTEPVGAEALIAMAIRQGLPVDTMERLLVMRRELQQEQARSAYTMAIAKFQGECPIIEKTKNVLGKDGRSVRYSYAPIDVIVREIKKPLMENGLSYSWNVKHADGFMEATCTITHVEGHRETSAFTIPIDKDGYMTEPQKYASAQTYAKRYALCNALGISTGEEDTDATTVASEPVAKSPKARIVFLLRQLGAKTSTKEEIVKAVQDATQLELVEAKYEEIVARLEVLVSEKQEYDNAKV